MHIRNRKLACVAAAGALALLLAVPFVAGAGRAGAAPALPRTLAREIVPQSVQTGAVPLVGAHRATDRLQLLFMLPLRDWAGLNAFLADTGNPQSANYGHYLTQDEANARFNPDPAHEASVLAWLRANGVADVETTPNHLYVLARATTTTFAQLLNIQINDYQATGRTFYAPDRAPTLPAAVSADISWIGGLDTEVQYHTNLRKGPAVSRASLAARHNSPTNNPPYAPSDFATAYDLNPLWTNGDTGGNATVAITLWSVAPSDTTLNGWSTDTAAPVATRANGRLTIVPVDGGGTDSDDTEAGLDIEAISGMAPAAHIKYFDAFGPYNSYLSHALNQAGTDPAVKLISNSWGGPESASARNTIDPILAANEATGHNYFFSSGDNGSWAGNNDPYPAYPTSSAYVTSVGGTAFNGAINGGWPGEQAWLYTASNPPEGSGGGFSLISPRPSWQTGLGTTGTKRGYPDVAAVGDPNTGFYSCSDFNGCIQIGGTSLSSPLWAGWTADVNQYMLARLGTTLGFLPPTLYNLANTAQTFPPYHDITIGTNGRYVAAAGWDPVTGWGSIDVWNLAQDVAGVIPPTVTPAPTATFAPGQIFSDVPPAAPFYAQINWCYSHGIISGYSNGDGTLRYQPNSSATRAQVSKMIVVASGWAIDTTGGPHFSDVPTSNPLYNFIETAYNHSIISGYGDGTFRPNNNVTRGQFAKIIVSARGWAIDTTGGPHFADVPASNGFYTFVETAYNHTIISGYACGGAGEPCPGTYFRAYNSITRGQLAKLINLSYGP
ncbi:MAG TPA: S-layer homology domain-containing protein [Chloroflexia bacterium]|nr:S-layer homology domain-containing protein [Chloroflexia bacterium]